MQTIAPVALLIYNDSKLSGWFQKVYDKFLQEYF